MVILIWFYSEYFIHLLDYAWAELSSFIRKLPEIFFFSFQAENTYLWRFPSCLDQLSFALNSLRDLSKRFYRTHKMNHLRIYESFIPLEETKKKITKKIKAFIKDTVHLTLIWPRLTLLLTHFTRRILFTIQKKNQLTLDFWFWLTFLLLANFELPMRN